jgi:regulator of protease activity HflC (stomatin/prohibitin superfamily)
VETQNGGKSCLKLQHLHFFAEPSRKLSVLRVYFILIRFHNTATEPWGIKIEMVEMKDVEIPEGMQRAMAREAEAIREKRARIIKAEAELDASIKLTQGAKQMEQSPFSLELRRMQMLSEIGIDNNTTTIILMPSEFVNAAKSFTEMVNK